MAAGNNKRCSCFCKADCTCGASGSRALPGDRRLHREVVGVADPADGVGVLAVALGELGRTPARDRLTDELLRGDQRAEEYEDDDIPGTRYRAPGTKYRVVPNTVLPDQDQDKRPRDERARERP